MIAPLPDWPLYGLADDIRPALRAAVAKGSAVALATIVGLDGGGPRPVGTQMLIGEEGLSGFLSGGCLEADIAAHAATVLASGEPARLIYGQGSPWPDIRLLCGSRVEVLLEALTPDDAAVASLLALGEARVPALWLSDGWRRACGPLGDPPETWSGAWAKIYPPATRLIVVGADPTALAIATLGAQAGLETTLVRPRGPIDPPPAAGIAYRREPPGEALGALAPDPWTAVAVATHDAALDHEALAAALPSPAFYVGALGARRRAPERIAALAAAGVDAANLERLVSPIGLDLGGKAPWEVAIAVLAQITACQGERLRPAVRTAGGLERRQRLADEPDVVVPDRRPRTDPKGDVVGAVDHFQRQGHLAAGPVVNPAALGEDAELVELGEDHGDGPGVDGVDTEGGVGGVDPALDLDDHHPAPDVHALGPQPAGGDAGEAILPNLPSPGLNVATADIVFTGEIAAAVVRMVPDGEGQQKFRQHAISPALAPIDPS